MILEVLQITISGDFDESERTTTSTLSSMENAEQRRLTATPEIKDEKGAANLIAAN
jgi:hypothetical protein